MDNNKKPQRNFEKETELLQLQLLNALSDKVMIQAMLDDALEKIEQLEKQESAE